MQIRVCMAVTTAKYLADRFLVISTALGLVDRELQKLHINILESNPEPQPVHPSQSQSPPSTSSLEPMQGPSYTVPPHGVFSITPPPNVNDAHLEQLAQQSQQQQQQQAQTQPQTQPHGQQQQFSGDIHIPYDTFSIDEPLPAPTNFSQDGIYDIAPELFEAFSYTEPIPTNVASGFDATWTPPAAPGSTEGSQGRTPH